MIYRIGASDLLYYGPPQSNVPFWAMSSTVLGQMIYCILDPPQSNVPFWAMSFTVLRIVINCIIPPLVQCTILGQVIYSIGASDLLYIDPSQSHEPVWGK